MLAASRHRTALSAFLAVLLLATLAPAAALTADDVTPPTGTLTIGDGSGFSTTPNVTLHVPATDDVAVTTVRVYVWGNLRLEVPYAASIAFTFPGVDQGFETRVEWLDAAGNRSSSETQTFVIDTFEPVVSDIRYAQGETFVDGMATVELQAWAWTGLTHARFKTGSGDWGQAIAIADPSTQPIAVDWPLFDPAFGGNPILGPRTVSYQVRNAAGAWSSVKKWVTGVASEGATIEVTGDIRTGHAVTFTPTRPAGTQYPASTVCMWELYWGNDQSLYHGERDETFGGITISGPKSKGYCDPWTVTLPWVPHRQFLVAFRGGPSDDPVIDVMIGSHPGDPKAVRPAVDSTSRHFKTSSLPMVYVLPDKYELIVGEKATYRGYPLAGETMKSTDEWHVSYINVPETKKGGTSFTFVPKVAGHLTVCWGSQVRKYTISACYDPPARRRDRTKPNTSAPKEKFSTGVAGPTVPVEVSWTGSDVGWGIAKYQLQRSVNGGAWKKVTLPKAKSKSIVQQLAYGTRYRYRVRAVDKAGNVGSWDTGPTFKPRRVADTTASSALKLSGSWKPVADPTAFGGILHESSKAGAAVRFTFTGRDIAWLAERGPGHGKAKVYVDGTFIKTVDLQAGADQSRRIVFRRSLTYGKHTIRIVLNGTAGRPLGSLDGFAILR